LYEPGGQIRGLFLVDLFFARYKGTNRSRQFRPPSNWTCEKPGGEPLFDGRKLGFLTRHRGSIYVTQQLHQDIEYLYRIECRPDK
jgi:hypothetical protein